MQYINEQEIFEINLNCNPQRVDIDQQRWYIQIDDFYVQPHLVAQLADTVPYSRSPRLYAGMPTNAYSGRSTVYFDFSHFAPVIGAVINSYYPRLRSSRSIADSIETVSFMCQVMCSTNLPATAPHIDTDQPGRFAATIGLTPNNRCVGGTSFYTLLTDQPTATLEYITDSTSEWQLDSVAPMAWNRLILYPSNYWHSAYVKPGWYDTPDQLRITQQFFI